MASFYSSFMIGSGIVVIVGGLAMLGNYITSNFPSVTEIKSRVDSNGYQHVIIDNSNKPDTTGVFDKEKFGLVGVYIPEAYGNTPIAWIPVTKELEKRFEWAYSHVGRRYEDGRMVD